MKDFDANFDSLNCLRNRLSKFIKELEETVDGIELNFIFLETLTDDI